MSNLNKVSDLVKIILEEEPQARNDDMTLYYLYCTKYGFSGSNNFYKIFDDKNYRNKLGISVFETVSRCRRKIQADNEYLKPSKETQQRRNEQEDLFKEFAVR